MRSTKNIFLWVVCAVTSSGAQALSFGTQPKQGTLKPSKALSGDDQPTRRLFLEQMISAATITIAIASVATPTVAALEKEDFSNEFVQELKARSDAKRSQYNQQAADGRTGWDKLNTAKFSSQYQRPKFLSVRRKDGTYKMLSPEEVDKLREAGVITAEYDTITDSQGNEIPDYKKGLVLQFATVKETIM